MEGLIGVLVALLLMFFGVSEQSALPPEPQPQEISHSLVVIDEVRVMILKSYPAQIVLQIDGHLPDGCDFPVQVTQRRDGNSVTLDLYREVPLGVMCPMIYREYHESIRLDGTFESGSYTIRVNDYEVQVTV